MAAKDSLKYGTRKRECYRIYDSTLGFTNRTDGNVNFLLDKWQKIENFEFSKRKNGKVLSKIILMFPNEWPEVKKEKVIEEFLREKFNNNHDFTFCFHGGKDGEVTHNSHGHLYYCERKLNDEKRRKDPAMSKLGFVDKFVKDWQKVCGIDLKKNPKVPRIPMMQWKANPDEARMIKARQKEDSISKKLEIFDLQKEILSLTLLSRRIIRNKKHSDQKSIFIPAENIQPAHQNTHLQNNLLEEKEKEKKYKFAQYISELLSRDHVLDLRTFAAELDANDIIINFDPEKGFLFETLDYQHQIYSSDLSLHDYS
ncbi:MobA/MobL family protein [Chryseobacterium caseinilyticum]|uniref:MobA/MobL family protein n=1 Tax=Chryseobacterium caseinilyticum TaxID=2771428 RepID=A0ABR8ZCP1_9FLAO|nr:MobA/MobL family protein [Chryseobacterium caseinilyticum]MBD8083007.1 MobA/MobL family protein [Chryseobacterium caseinilyticum]